MSGLWMDPADDGDVLEAVARRDPIGGPGFFDGALEAAGRVVPQALASAALAWDDAYMSSMRAAPASAGMNPLRALEQAQDEGVSVEEIFERRRAEKIENFERSKERYFRLGPDPATTGAAGNFLQGFGVMATQGVAGGIVGGPVGAAAAIKALTYAPEKIALVDEGVPENVAADVANEQSTWNGALALAPGALPGRLVARAASGAGINAGLGVAQRWRASEALQNAGYPDAAARYEPFDAQSLAIDVALGAFFGGAFGDKGSPRVPRETLDAALTVRDAQRRDTRSPRGMPLNNAADRQIAAADARAQEQMARGEPIDVADIFDEGTPATLADLDRNIEPWIAPEDVVQSMLEWQKSTAPEAPMSLTDFIKSKGGISTRLMKNSELVDTPGAAEVRRLTGGTDKKASNGVAGMVNDASRFDLERMAEAAWEAGYLGYKTETWDTDEFLALLRQDIAARGSKDVSKRVFSADEEDYMSEAGSYDAISQDAARLGIKKNHSEATVRDILSRSELAQRAGDERPQYADIDPHEAERAELMDHLVAAFREDPSFIENAEMLGDLGDDPFADLMYSRGAKPPTEPTPRDPNAPTEGMAARVYDLSREGKSNKDIATELGSTPGSVAAMKTQMRKDGVDIPNGKSGRAEVVAPAASADPWDGYRKLDNGFVEMLPYKEKWGDPGNNDADRAHAALRLGEIQTMDVKKASWPEVQEARKDIAEILSQYYATDPAHPDRALKTGGIDIRLYFIERGKPEVERSENLLNSKYWMNAPALGTNQHLMDQATRAVLHLYASSRAGVKELMIWGNEDMRDPRSRRSNLPDKFDKTRASGFFSPAGRGLSRIPDGTFELGGMAVINALRKEPGVTLAELQHLRLLEIFGGEKKVTREQFKIAIADRHIELVKRISWFNPERTMWRNSEGGSASHEQGGTRAFSGPRIPGRAVYFEERAAFPKKLPGGDPFAPGFFDSPHWPNPDNTAFSWRASLRELLKWGKTVVGEEGQSDFMQGKLGRHGRTGRRPAVTQAEFMAMKKLRPAYLAALQQAKDAKKFAESPFEQKLPANAWSPPRPGDPLTYSEREAIRKPALESFNGAFEAGNDNWLSDLKEVIRMLADGTNEGTISKLIEYRVAREAAPDFFTKDAYKKYLKTESSFTPDTPIDDKWADVMLRILLTRAVREGADSIAISTSDTTARIQNNPKAAFFYDGTMRPKMEKMLRRFGGGENATVEMATLPKALGAPRNEAPYTVWIAKITPEMRKLVIAEGLPFYSRGEVGAGAPITAIEAALRASFGSSTEKLMDRGRVQVVGTVQDLRDITGKDLGNDTKAVHARGLGKSFIVAENMTPEMARSVVLHEVGVHHGLEQMLGPRGMEALRGQIDKLIEANHPAVIDARAAAEAFSMKPEHVEAETVAYLVENHPELPMVQRLLAQIRQWLWRAFPGLVDLTPADIQAMAVASLRRVANNDARGFGDLTDVMTSFGAGLATPEGRRAWANSSEVLRVEAGNDITYSFTSPGGPIDVQFHRERSGAWGIVWDWSKNTQEDNKFADGSFDGKPFQSLGKIIGVIERFLAQNNPDAIHFAGLSNTHTQIYSRMIMAVMPDGWKAWDVSGEQNRAHEFAIARGDVDVKAAFPQATPIEKVLTKSDIAAKSERAKDFGVRAYLDWFRESGGDELQASRGGKKKTPRDENTADMFDPVKAAIADDPSLTIPDDAGGDLSAERAIETATEEVKAAQELTKGFEAAGACAGRHAMGLAHAADKRVASMFGSLTGGAVAGGVIANAAVPALQDANDAQRAAEIEASSKKNQARIKKERAQFQRDNPVTSIPMGRDMDNTAMHVGERLGVPADFMHALAMHESGGDASAEATTSSAVGATQFLEGTWTAMLKEVGPELGFKGDPKSQEALDLRKDQRWAMAVGAEFAKSNARVLKAALDRDPTQKEVYLAHFMGVAGAKRLIKAAAEGETNAASAFPAEAAANANVFRGSAQDVINRQGRNFSDAPFKVSEK